MERRDWAAPRDGAGPWEVVSLDRTGRIGWIWFDQNPGYYDWRDVEQSFEEFLEHGPPKGQQVPLEMVEELRAHLLQRTPGRSTYLTAGARCLTPDGTLNTHGWALDDKPLSYSKAGFFVGGTNFDGMPVRSLLLFPGKHRLTVQLHATIGHWPHDGAAEITFTIDRAQHLHLALEVSVPKLKGQPVCLWSMETRSNPEATPQ